MSKIKAITILSLCNLYVSEGRAAEDDWWTQTVRKFENLFDENKDELPKPGSYKPKDGHMLFGEKHMMDSIKRFGGTLPSSPTKTNATVKPTKGVATNQGRNSPSQSDSQQLDYYPMNDTSGYAPQEGYTINGFTCDDPQAFELKNFNPPRENTSPLYPQIPYDNSQGTSFSSYANTYPQPPLSHQQFQIYTPEGAYLSQLGGRHFPAQFPHQQVYTTPGVDGSSVQTYSSSQIPQLPIEQTWPVIPTPPVKMPFISHNKIARMKQDENFTDQLLELIYWNVIENHYKIEDIKDNPYIRQVLKGTPDHRLWMVIYSLKAFDCFPGLVNFIQKQADEALLVTAQDMIGRMYLYGEGVKKDTQRGITYLSLSDAQGFATSQASLGEYYWNEKKYHLSSQSFLSAAKQGHLAAKISVGISYQYGCGVEKSYDQALKYYFEANNHFSKNYILKILQPIQTQLHDSSFSELKFFYEIEGQLGELISLYYPEVPIIESAGFSEIQTSNIAQGRLGIYKMLEEAISFIGELKSLSPGFAINCLIPIETITRGQTNPSPEFYSYTTLKMTNNSYMFLGEENVKIQERLSKVINFFYEGFRKYFEVEKPIVDYSGKEKDCADLNNTILSLAQLLATDISDADKAIFQGELIQTRCKLALKKQEILNLQQISETNKNLKRDFPIFEGIYLLLENYLEAGVDLRNKKFLKEYPYLAYSPETK